MQALVNAMGESAKMERSKYQLTLGEIIKKLDDIDGNKNVIVDIDGFLSVGEPASYRGYYSDLAFEPSDEEITVKDFLKLCKDSNGISFEGYKGGDFKMEDDTPLWISEYGCCSDIAIMDIVDGDHVTIVTKEIE